MRPAVFVLLLLGLAAEARAVLRGTQHLTVIVDAGSTGSRLYLYGVDGAGNVDVESGLQVEPGLSSFGEPDAPAPAAGAVGEYLAPLFDDALDRLGGSASEARRARVLILATAGVRSLPADRQRGVLARVRGEFAAACAPWVLEPADARVLTGREEAQFALLSVNFLRGGIDGRLRATGEPLTAALDLGGSSTQVVFFPRSAWPARGRVLDVDAAYAESFAGYGASAAHRAVAADDAEGACEFSPEGTGDASACAALVRSRLAAGGVGAPPELATQSVTALSMYFFATDCLRAASPAGLPEWPAPSPNQIRASADALCAASPETLSEHQFSRGARMLTRCFDGVYVSELLTALGVDRDAHSVTFARHLDGYDVEWTLGAMLSAQAAGEAPALIKAQHYLSPLLLVGVVVACLFWRSASRKASGAGGSSGSASADRDRAV